MAAGEDTQRFRGGLVLKARPLREGLSTRAEAAIGDEKESLPPVLTAGCSQPVLRAVWGLEGAGFSWRRLTGRVLVWMVVGGAAARRKGASKKVRL